MFKPQTTRYNHDPAGTWRRGLTEGGALFANHPELMRQFRIIVSHGDGGDGDGGGDGDPDLYTLKKSGDPSAPSPPPASADGGPGGPRSAPGDAGAGGAGRPGRPGGGGRPHGIAHGIAHGIGGGAAPRTTGGASGGNTLLQKGHACTCCNAQRCDCNAPDKRLVSGSGRANEFERSGANRDRRRDVWTTADFYSD